MEEEYRVYFQKKLIGKSRIYRNGLYYHVCCQCDLPGGDIYRLAGIGENGTLDLGICIPEKGKLILHKNIPANRFSVGIEYLELKVNNTAETVEFVVLKQDEPFSYLSKLIGAKLCLLGDEIGVVFDD